MSNEKPLIAARTHLRDKLWSDCKTDRERADFILSGRAFETGVIAPCIQAEVAMAFHRLALLSAAPVPAAVPSTTEETIRTATQYAHNLVVSLHRDHYQDNNSFEPFDDLLGLLSQIDNMICGWKEPAAVPDANQCDGCAAGMELSEGKHYDRHGFVVMSCQAHRYAAPATAPAAVPEGYVLVPVNLPEDALTAAGDNWSGWEESSLKYYKPSDSDIRILWRAMLAAAQKGGE